MKPFVNDYKMYQEFLGYINDKISAIRMRLELQVDPHEIYRAQGEIRALRQLLKLREEINGRE